MSSRSWDLRSACPWGRDREEGWVQQGWAREVEWEQGQEWGQVRGWEGQGQGSSFLRTGRQLRQVQLCCIY